MPLTSRNAVVLGLLGTLWLSLAAVPVRGVILYSGSTRNTDVPGSLSNRDQGAPNGAGDSRALLNSGWQYEGVYDTGLGFFLGTAIAPSYFLTAAHVGYGGTFVYQGTPYTVANYYQSPSSDLRLIKVNGTLPSYAPLWNSSVDGAETGKQLVVIGRGTQRGGEVRVGGQLKGWMWGAEDHVQSWGTNIVSNIYDDSSAGYGDLLGFDFDANGDANESALSGGDSGGGVFIKSGSTWKLAGINFSVDGPWSYTDGGASFNAALFDAGGLYFYNPGDGSYTSIPDDSSNQSGTSYSTRISSNLSWIQSIIGNPPAVALPEPASGAVLAGVVAFAARRRR